MTFLRKRKQFFLREVILYLYVGATDYFLIFLKSYENGSRLLNVLKKNELQKQNADFFIKFSVVLVLQGQIGGIGSSFV